MNWSLIRASNPRNPVVPSSFDWSTIDGSRSAPAGVQQYPALLAGYAKRPPWNVAGVEYPVGPRSTPATDPATLPTSGGVFKDAANAIVHVNSNNQTVSGYDFSLATATGGKSWVLKIDAGVSGTIIQDCNFVWSANTSGAVFYLIGPNGTPGTGCTIQYCTIDGGSFTAGNQGGMVNYDAPGLVVQYCWIKRAQNDCVDTAYSPVIKFNLFDDYPHQTVGSDADGLQLDPANPSSSTPIAQFNTFRFPAGGIKANSGLQATANTGVTITALDFSYNTMVALGSSTVQVMIEVNVATVSPGTNDGAIIQHNYMDLTGATQPFYTSTGANHATNLHYGDNWDMVNNTLLTTTP